MLIPCPNCMTMVEQQVLPTRADKGHGEIWMCMKCPALICSHPVFSDPETSEPCYVKHTREAHPEVYGLKKPPTGDGKKNKKGKKR